MNSGKPELYRDLARQLMALLAGETDRIANAANMAALIYHGLPDLNWAGFYFRKGDELVLGPFQGRPACLRIAIGQGVCGTAAARGEAVLVADVHDFPGHIACDPVSRSELVMPLIEDSEVIGVLDLDSPLLGALRRSGSAGLRGAGRAVRQPPSPDCDANRVSRGHRSGIGLSSAITETRGSGRGGATGLRPPRRPRRRDLARAQGPRRDPAAQPRTRAARGRSTITSATRRASAGGCANWRS